MRRFFPIALILAVLVLPGLTGCAPQAGTSLAPAQRSSRQQQLTNQQTSPELEKRDREADALFQQAESYQPTEEGQQSRADYERAKAAYERGMATAAHIPAEMHYRYGTVLSRLGEYRAAIEQFAIYNEKAGTGAEFSAAANQEMSFAQSELGRQQALAEQQAAEQARQEVLREAQQAYEPPPAVAVTQLQQQLQQSAPQIVEPLTGMELRLVKGGCYSMGDQFGDADQRELAHQVCVDAFYIGTTEVTQGQWQKLMGTNPAHFQKGTDYPVEMVAWVDVQGFLQLLNRAGGAYRLPTEAEWEYAARSGGKRERFSGGNSVDAVAWYVRNSGGSTHPVGRKQPNGLGLYDMSGNVAEWCQDYWTRGYYQLSPRDNPTGGETPSRAGYRIARGGSFSNDPFGVRTSIRSAYDENRERDRELGFRVVLPLSAATAAPR